MSFEVSTQLPGHMPGKSDASFKRVAMTPAAAGGAMLYAIDPNDEMTLWLSSDDGLAQWTQVPFKVRGHALKVISVDVVANVATSGFSHSIDLLVVARAPNGHPAIYHFDRADAARSAREWMLAFEGAEALDLAIVPAGVKLSTAPHAGLRPFVAWGQHAAAPEPKAIWVGPDASGHRQARALHLPGHIQSFAGVAMACGIASELDNHLDGVFVSYPGSGAHSVDFIVPETASESQRVLHVRSPHAGPNTWHEVTDICCAPYLTPSPATIAYFRVAEADGTLSTFTLNAYFPDDPNQPPTKVHDPLGDFVGAGRHVSAVLNSKGHHKFEHIFDLAVPVDPREAAAQGAGHVLREISGAGLVRDQATLVASNVDNFSACVCPVRDADGTLQSGFRFAVCYTTGGVAILSRGAGGNLHRHALIADKHS